jgi:hypothetical protein
MCRAQADQTGERRGAGATGDRQVLAAIVFVARATSGCAWRQLLPVFEASWWTVCRRFAGGSVA